MIDFYSFFSSAIMASVGLLHSRFLVPKFSSVLRFESIAVVYSSWGMCCGITVGRCEWIMGGG